MTTLWWANQGRTGFLEREAGVLRAPMRGSAGQRVPHFATLEQMRAGDLVVHYERGYLVAVSTIQSPAVHAPRPYQPDDRDGLLVRVDVAELDLYLPLSEIPVDVRVASAGGGSVFDVNGDARDGYAFPVPVPVPAATTIRTLLGAHDTNSDTDTGHGGRAGGQLSVAATDGVRVGSYRIEQPELRRRVIGSGPTGMCVFCGRALPVRFLVTAHIKPRAVCSFRERTDSNVVVAACTLGCDTLYEHGVFHVDPVGVIRAAADPNHVDLADAAAVLDGRTVRGHHADNAAYFAWQRRHRRLRRHRSTCTPRQAHT